MWQQRRESSQSERSGRVSPAARHCLHVPARPLAARLDVSAASSGPPPAPQARRRDLARHKIFWQGPRL